MKKSRFHLKQAVACGLCAMFLMGAAAPANTAFAASKAEQAKAKQLFTNAYNDYKNGNIIAAADGFMAASKLDEKNPLIAMSAGDMLRRLKQYPSAIKYFEIAKDNFGKAPKGTKDRVVLMTYSGLSQAYLESGDKDKAIENAEEITRRFKKKYDGWYLLGQIYADKHMDDAKAIECFNKALDADDMRVDVYNALVDLYKQKSDNDGVEKTLKRGCLARPLDETMKAQLGQLYLEWHEGDKNHYAEAEQVFKDLVGLNEKSAWGHYYLGATYALEGKFDDAANELATLSSLNRNLANRLESDINQQRETQGAGTGSGVPTVTVNNPPPTP